MKALAFVAALALATPAMAGKFPPPGTYDHSFPIASSYEKVIDRTVLEVNFGIVKSVGFVFRDQILLSLSESFLGRNRERPNGPPIMQIASTARGGYRYESDHKVTFAVDGESFTIDSSYVKGGEGASKSEHLLIEFTWEQFEKLSSAKEVKIRFGEDELTFGGAWLEATRDLASYIDHPGRAVSTPEVKKLYRDAKILIEAGQTEKALFAVDKLKRQHGRTYEAEAAGELLRQAEDCLRAGPPKSIKDGMPLPKLPAPELAATKLKLAKALEATNPKGALEYYREVAKDFPGTEEAKQAGERAKAMGKKR